jgi:hypothetical protein
MEEPTFKNKKKFIHRLLINRIPDWFSTSFSRLLGLAAQ